MHNQFTQTVIKKIHEINDKSTVTTAQVQEAINCCNIPQFIKTFLLWLTAWSLRKRGIFSFLKVYIKIFAVGIFIYPDILEKLIVLLFEKDNKVVNILLTTIQLFNGTIDHIVFCGITFVVIIVIICNFTIKYHETKANNILKNLIDELTFNPEKDWFNNKCKLAIKTLGNRYSSEINYRNPKLSNVYSVLITPEKWIISFKRKLQIYLKECKHLYDNLPEQIKQENRNIDNKITEIIEVYNNQQYNKFETIYDDIKTIFHDFVNISYSNRDVISSYEIDSLHDYIKKIEKNTSIYKFFGTPVLYIKGDAGSGKTHFLADIVNARMKYNLKSLLALGLDFNQIGDVRERLMNIWGVKGNWDDFLVKLNKIGELEKHRILIIIDGINEGLGNQLWPDVLAGLEADIIQYPNLGLIISARTFSKTNILDEISKDKATITLDGFRGMEDEAITYLTGKFGITLPQISYYKKEFANPLFLILYCQSYSDATITNPNSFLDVAKNYMDMVNKKLSPKYGYQAALYNYTNQVTNILVELYVSQKTKQMVKFQKFDDLLIKAETVIPNGMAHNYLQDLVSEGVLMCYINNKEEILVDFNFDIVGDYVYAEALINKQWKEYKGRIYDVGIYEATSVLLPLMNGIEIFDHTTCDISNEYRYELFIQTLKQRFIISSTAIEEIKKIKNVDIYSFYEILPVIATHHECNSIIKILNDELKEMSMVERDEKWSMYYTIDCIDPTQTELVKLSQWAASISRQSSDTMSEHTAYQMSCVLIWGFSSPYRLLRDVATKAVINLLQDKPKTLMRIIDIFDDVNDPYIQQRLYAVVHGCVFRGNCGFSAELGKKIFENVFNVKAVRPDILLRDYARCAIDFIYQHTNIVDIDISKIEPPYSSKFNFNQCPSREISETKYRLNKTVGTSIATVYTQNKILDSMETEYSNGVGNYGDFGRYVFESYLCRWKNCENYNASLLRSYALDIIFDKYKFNANIYQRHDYICNYHGRRRPIMERFGKKFQWIALYEILGLLQDNYLIESDVSDDKNIQCDGTWDPCVRDIDTTTTYANYFNKDTPIPRDEPLDWMCLSSMPLKIKHEDKWLTNKEGISTDLASRSILVKDDDGEEWIVLYGYNNMSPESPNILIDKEEISLWEFLQAYIVPRKCRNSVANFIYKKGTHNRVMPEYRNNIYSLFYKDYYLSASYREYARRTKIDKWDNFGNKRTEYQIGYLPYTCENEMTVYKLNKKLFEVLELKDGNKEGEYVNGSGDIIAFDPSVKYQNSGQLLVRKKEILAALKNNNLSLVWPILFEKQKGTYAIGCQFGGSAYLTDKGKIKVKMRLYKESSPNYNRQHKKDKMWKNYIKLIWYIISFNKLQKEKIKMKIKFVKQYSS